MRTYSHVLFHCFATRTLLRFFNLGSQSRLYPLIDFWHGAEFMVLPIMVHHPGPEAPEHLQHWDATTTTMQKLLHRVPNLQGMTQVIVNFLFIFFYSSPKIRIFMSPSFSGAQFTRERPAVLYLFLCYFLGLPGWTVTAHLEKFCQAEKIPCFLEVREQQKWLPDTFQTERVQELPTLHPDTLGRQCGELAAVLLWKWFENITSLCTSQNIPSVSVSGLGFPETLFNNAGILLMLTINFICFWGRTWAEMNFE